MDSDFEAFRRERNYRRRQQTPTDRPEGNRAVWEAIEEREEQEMRNQLINAEVDDFFSDATRLAANIVKKVSEHHDQEISDQLRAELEEFLLESIRHATNMVNRLPTDSNIAEKVVEPNLRNLETREIDEFRAEGTAQLDDKHLGQDLFGDDDDEDFDDAAPADDAAPEMSGAEDVEDDNDLLGNRLHLNEGELALDYTSEEAEDFVADEFTAQPAGTLIDDDSENPPADDEDEDVDDTPVSEEDELPLAALFEGDGQTRAPAPAPAAVSAPPAPAPAPARRKKAPAADPIREALLLLVKQGVMTKDQARAAYRAQTRKA